MPGACNGCVLCLCWKNENGAVRIEGRGWTKWLAERAAVSVLIVLVAACGRRGSDV